MQAVVKTPRIDVRITGEISEKLIKALEEEYGDDLIIITDPDEEFVGAQETSWYKNIKSELTPGQVLQIYRENAGLTQEALGKILGDLPKQHISNMENNHRKITLEMAKKLASVFNTSPARFLDL